MPQALTERMLKAEMITSTGTLTGLVSLSDLVVTAIFGEGLLATIGAGAFSGALSGQYGRLMGLALTGQMSQAGSVMFQWQDLFLDAALGGALSGAIYGVGKALSSSSLPADTVCANSFSGDTEVATEDGQKPIREIVVGEKVLAFDEGKNQTNYYPVTGVINHSDTTIVKLIIDNEEIITTQDHPFYTLENGWMNAGKLVIGQHIRRSDGSSGIVKSVKVIQEIKQMYNLTVDQEHTFFVGEEEWLVHNACWNVGEKINLPDETGNYPSWELVRSRYWMNQAQNFTGADYGPQNIARMKAGYPPVARILGQLKSTGNDVEMLVSKELHHIMGRQIIDPHAIENLQELWPWEHANLDPNRFINYIFKGFK